MSGSFQFAIFKEHPAVLQATSYRQEPELLQFAKQLNVNKFVIGNQIHEEKILIVTADNYQPYVSGYDGYITREPEIALVIKTADCCPVLIYDQKQNIIAALHAGRRSTELKIVENCLNILTTEFKSQPADLLCSIGPCICNDCYQIDKEKDLHYDLVGRNLKQLKKFKIPAKNIELANRCTVCNNDQFFSYRKENTILRTFNLMMLK